MRRKIVYLFTLLSVCLPINAPKVQAQGITQEDISIRQRPNSNKPTEVAVGLYLIKFDTFNEQTDSFTLDGYLYLTWQDKRLAFSPSQNRKNNKIYNLEESWSPNVKFLNIKGKREIAYTKLEVKPDGTVKYKERFTGEFNLETNLKRFPFDSQKITLILESLDDIRNVNFVIDKSRTGRAKDAFLTEWKIGEHRALVKARNFEVEELDYPEFIYEVTIARYYNPYIWNIFIPLLFIVSVSWTVFWSRSFESNTVIATSSLVSAIAFNIVIAEELPKVSYLTFINGFILIIYIFICLVIIYTVLKHLLDLENKKKLSLRIDRITRWLVPIAFGASNIFLIAIFLL